MSTLKKRNEMDQAYLWDLSSLYPSDEVFEVDFNKVPDLIKALKAKEGKVLASPEDLHETIELVLKIDRIANNLYTYGHMKRDENAKDSTYQSMASRTEALAVKATSASSFFEPEVLAGEESLIKDYLTSYEPLQGYEWFLENVLRKKAHTLSAKEEALLAKAGELANAPSTIFGMLNNADFTFPSIQDEEGKEVQITHGNFIPFMESEDRRVRKDAFTALYSVFKGHENALAAALQAEVKKNIFFAEAKNFASAQEAALFENHIPVAVYDQLIEAVHEALPMMHEYMKIRKDALGVDELHMYDVYTPIVENVSFKVPYETAKELVAKALSPLGEAYTEVVRRSYQEGWIDVFENEGKRSGAYSWGTYDSNPYILLNYHDTLDNMYTLAHEMGHSMHSFLTREKQPYVYGNYSIFVAEVASTANEALLNDYLLKTEKDDLKKKFILNHYLETFRGTLFRQTMFAEFERLIHRHVEGGGSLTADFLKQEYHKLNEKYYGPHMVIDEEIAYEWARIPHFYYNHYVYQYATGFSAAIALAQQLLEEGAPAQERYLNFLGGGSSKDPISLLQGAGADMASGEPVAKALELFGQLVKEFKSLL